MMAQLSNGIKSQNSGMTIVKIMKKSIDPQNLITNDFEENRSRQSGG
jgi:hypothetical protein